MEIKLDPRNYRKHDKKNKDLINKSLKECGAGRSIVIDNEDNIIAGNGIYEQAQKLGLKTKVIETDGSELVVVKRTDLATEDEKRKQLAIMDNSTSDTSTFDFEILQADFDTETLIDYGLPIDFKIEEPQEVVEYEVPESVDTRCKRGDIWKLGNHRLMCGDSTVITDVEKLMDGNKADLLLTDPPYGVNRDKGFGGFGGFGKPIKRRTYSDVWDSQTPPKECFDLILLQAEKTIIFGGNFFTDKLPVGTFWIVWDKHNTMPTFGDCELAWTNIERKSVKKYDIEYNGLIGKEKDRYHPTQKPVKLFASILKDFSDDKNSILDLFGGSGSTLIACEQLNRTCYMMELDEHYCDVIIQRWENLTGKKAERSNNGANL